MRKLKYILASFVLASAFASCETEPIDEKVKDDSLEGKPIFSFDLNDKQTVVADKVDVNFTGSGITINTIVSILNLEEISDPAKRYKPGVLSISFSSFTVGNFPAQLSIENPSNFLSSANLTVLEPLPDDEGEIHNVWVKYSTDNAAENQNTGYGNINEVNGTAKYMHGNFDYILLPEAGMPLEPQRVTKGIFYYINY